MSKIISFPVKTSEQAEIEAVEADDELTNWIMSKLEDGMSAYTLLGIINLNSQWLSSMIIEEQQEQ